MFKILKGLAQCPSKKFNGTPGWTKVRKVRVWHQLPRRLLRKHLLKKNGSWIITSHTVIGGLDLGAHSQHSDQRIKLLKAVSVRWLIRRYPTASVSDPSMDDGAILNSCFLRTRKYVLNEKKKFSWWLDKIQLWNCIRCSISDTSNTFLPDAAYGNVIRIDSYLFPMCSMYAYVHHMLGFSLVFFFLLTCTSIFIHLA